MRLSVLILAVCFLPKFKSIGQEKATHNFSLVGNIKNNYSGYIYLNYEDNVDSSLIKDNHFNFRGRLNEDVVLASFSFKNKDNNFPLLYLEKSEIFIDLTIQDRNVNGNTIAMIDIINTNGTKTSIIQKDYENFINEFKDKPNFLQKRIDKVESIVNSYPKIPYSASLVFLLTKIDSLDKTRLIKIYEKLDKTKLSNFYKKNIEKNIYTEQRVEVNDMIFDFELLDKNNLSFNTKSLRGKWILIDFWASWCGPCRKQLPELKKLYNSNTKSNFEIIGVSIDEDGEKWQEALTTEKLDWINVNENQGFYGKVAITYKVEYLPLNYLINPEGKIIAKDITIEELQEILDIM